MSDNTPIGDRMKRYEHTFRTYMPRRAYTLMRLDGRAFRTYLKNVEKPFDREFVKHMDLLSEYLAEEISGTKLVYTQSDEISLLLTDFDSIHMDPMFGGRIQKLVSIAASEAGAYMTRLRYFQPGRLPSFDCRVWSMTDPVEVANYFIWRQRDAVRNSILMLGQHYFTPAQLHGKSGDQIQDMLFLEHEVNWDKLDPGLKRGRVVVPTADGWLTASAPHFVAQPGSSLAQLIPSLPSLE